MAEPTISEKIRAIRAHRNVSQEELARLLQVSFPTVNAWERGRSVPYPRHQRAINELYVVAVRPANVRRVLIVEDDPAAALILSDYVAMALPDWETLTVTNGYDAILQIGLLRPAIVLLDIMMPEIDGLKVYARLKELDELKDTRVIFVTAATDEAILARARGAGAAALVQKPLRRQEMIAVLRAAAG